MTTLIQSPSRSYSVHIEREGRVESTCYKFFDRRAGHPEIRIDDLNWGNTFYADEKDLPADKYLTDHPAYNEVLRYLRDTYGPHTPNLTIKRVCTIEQHHNKLKSGDWDERAGGSLHCPRCDEKIGRLRQ